jgi:hypothetical protein
MVKWLGDNTDLLAKFAQAAVGVATLRRCGQNR